MYNVDLERQLQTSDDLARLLRRVKSLKQAEIISFVNPFSYPIIVKDGFENKIDHWFVDGAFLCFLTNLFRVQERRIERVSFDFSSIAGHVLSFAKENQLRVGLVGGTNEEVALAKLYFKGRYDGIEIPVALSGYGVFDDPEPTIDELREAGCQIIIVGMGTPLQEDFSLTLKAAGIRAMIFTCGGFLSQTAKRGDYYRPIIKSLGLRWLQRAVSDSHVRSRLVNVYPKFIISYLLGGMLTLSRKSPFK